MHLTMLVVEQRSPRSAGFKISVGKPVGKMPVGKMPVGKMPVGKISERYQQVYQSKGYPFGRRVITKPVSDCVFLIGRSWRPLNSSSQMYPATIPRRSSEGRGHGWRSELLAGFTHLQ